jgi:hypothetical protein
MISQHIPTVKGKVMVVYSSLISFLSFSRNVKQIDCSWIMLRRQGQSPVFRTTLFFPVIAAVVSLGGNELQILGFSVSVNGWFMSRIYVLYFSVLLLSAASIIYALRCPTAIKDFQGAMVYIDARLHTFIYSSTIRRMITQAKKYEKEYSEELSKYRSDSDRSKGEEYVAMLRRDIAAITLISSFPAKDQDVDKIASFMSSYWNVINYSRSQERLIVYILFRLGNILFALCMLMSVGHVLVDSVIFLASGLISAIKYPFS